MRVEKFEAYWTLDIGSVEALTIYSKERLSELCNRLGLIFDEIKSPTLSGKMAQFVYRMPKEFRNVTD
jgi:hypothetical protein